MRGGQVRRSRLFHIARQKQLCNKLFFYEYFHTNGNFANTHKIIYFQKYKHRKVITTVNMHKLHINEMRNST